MTAPVLHPGPLTAELVARALVAASAEYGVDPETVFVQARDGRGRARLLAAAALIHPEDRSAALCAKVMAVHVVQLSPSGLAGRKIYSEAVERVRKALVVAPKAAPLNVDVRVRRGDPGYVDPRRDTACEERILKARRDGDSPRTIASAEGMSLGSVKGILTRSGETFPPARPGPNRGGRPARPKTEAAPTPRAPRRPREPKILPEPAAAVAAATVAPVEPFPADHPTWSPLPGVTPETLIAHTRGCRWPVTVEGRREAMVCNAGIHPGSPYCGRHLWLSLAPSGRAQLAQFSPAASTAPRMARPLAAADLKDEAA